MKAIVCTDCYWGIGKDNDLLFHIDEDMKFFSEMTKNNIVVMGRKTFESLPNKKPLKDRLNIVMTRDYDFHADGVITVHSDADLRIELAKHPKDEVFIIGGECIYYEYIDECTDAWVTKVQCYKEFDARFPDLAHKKNWIWSQTDAKIFFGTDRFTDTSYKCILHHYINIDKNGDALRLKPE